MALRESESKGRNWSLWRWRENALRSSRRGRWSSRRKEREKPPTPRLSRGRGGAGKCTYKVSVYETDPSRRAQRATESERPVRLSCPAPSSLPLSPPLPNMDMWMFSGCGGAFLVMFRPASRRRFLPSAGAALMAGRRSGQGSRCVFWPHAFSVCIYAGSGVEFSIVVLTGRSHRNRLMSPTALWDVANFHGGRLRYRP